MQTKKGNIAYIIGDSAVRSFAYNNYFIPIMISAGAFNSHLTTDSSKGVTERYKAFFEEYDLEGEVVYFFTNADTIHHVRDTFNTLERGEVALYEAASRYIDMVLMLKKQFNIDSLLLSSIPLDGKFGMDTAITYNDHLKKLARINNIKYVDIWIYITKKINVKPEIIQDFFADDIGHLNHRFVYDFLKRMGVIEDGQCYWDVEYERYYNYEMPIVKLGGQFAKIWGDCPKDTLILDKGMAYQFNLFHQKTSEHEELLSLVQPIFRKFLHYDSVTVDGCKDGYVAFALSRMNFFKSINARDFDERFIVQANALKKIFKLAKITFFVESEKKIQFHEIVISLTKNLLTKKNKVKYFRNLNKSNVKVLVFYSTDIANDYKILTKNGFSKIYDLKLQIRGVNKPVYSYLLCFNSDFSSWVKIKLKLFLLYEGVRKKFIRYSRKLIYSRKSI
jgi:hypothetical protein